MLLSGETVLTTIILQSSDEVQQELCLSGELV